MAALAQAESNRLLDASLGTASYTAPTTPMKLAVMSTTGTTTAAGTEFTGGSYARQTIAFGSASSASASNSGAISFTNSPALTANSVEIYDSAGTPRRGWFGALTTPKTLNSGDTLSFAIASIVASLS